ncbi:MAG: septum site-determining protein MinC [Anaerolineae bacterium]|nr:septum site-determining protein MinC [Anaerolineae bacterium]
MAEDPITVKGIRDGLLITLGEGPWEERLLRLAGRLQAGATFFQGGRAALDVGARELDGEQIERVRDLLARSGVELWALLSSCDATVIAAVRAGLVPDLELGLPAQQSAPTQEPPAPTGALVVERTLRSGQRLEHPGDVVIIGDVHAGAEVVAGRHVVVWGWLRGMVHAGAMGDDSAIVCALGLAPTQLRIAGHISRSPDEKQRDVVPEMARVRNGRIEAIPWQ